MFDSFFMAGFECSSHRRADGRRLDLLASSGHDRLAESDYRRIGDLGLRVARDGLRWHLIETAPGHYDWSSFLPMLRASHRNGVHVFWDLCHYGWPDDIDIWSPEFVERFGKFAAAAARLIREETGETPMVCPVNEISYWAWAGAEVGKMNPAAHGRAAELKRQLVRVALAAIEAVREIDPQARFLFAEPAIHVDGGSGPAEHQAEAENYRLSQFEAYDMLTGLAAPELGGTPGHLDLVGMNYYPDNQWYLHGSTIPLGHHAYQPFRAMLAEVFRRYGRPIVVSETGAEGTARPAWLHYVASEVEAAIAGGIPVEGICIYPVADCPGWEDERVRPLGLLSEPGPEGTREIYGPLADEMRRQEQDRAPADVARRRPRIPKELRIGP
ncbi:Beta-glucosidase/6-phospho-beta-glucosidase/beta-galactosidase [Faunimonas pinastri]|uniref:Beta-glucosidase/6-phospho-beta-glucosidase/beta-galactosidase n=1 Tax=Faunimonas pinastri TaxID=1855383 RepID=A0A1H9Q1S8_9HYPH|nr:beta-glucosidase [Faunimonas pinastri]SER54417.1 Beta-glucosidase/6-phospho-beta-glucosidase/beta-galactosidase [Faunimonas pinastri]